MDFVFVGYAAGFLTTASFIPQVVRAYRTRSCHDLSWPWLMFFSVGLALWISYGVHHHEWPIILANAFTLALCGVLMTMKFLHGSRD
jgi:MtN3 and saliva related transmembrane protein